MPFENLDYNTLYHYEAPENQAQTDPASYAQFASGYLSGKSITYRETGNRDTDQGQIKTYTVYADGKRFATNPPFEPVGTITAFFTIFSRSRLICSMVLRMV